MSLGIAGVCAVSFKYSVWSFSLYHYEVTTSISALLSIGTALVLTVWLVFAVYALAAAFKEYQEEDAREAYAARQEYLNRDTEPGSLDAAMQQIELINDYWAGGGFRQTNVDPDAHPQPEPVAYFQKTQAEKRHGLFALLVSFHLAAYGASAVSFAFLHVTLPLRFWLVAAVCAGVGAVGVPFVFVRAYALLRSDDRKPGETATQFTFRKMVEHFSRSHPATMSTS